jgi:ABC-type transport system involved in multi-copper enzyme maturation permease subunit
MSVIINFFYHLGILSAEELRELLFRKRSLVALLFYFAVVSGAVWVIISLENSVSPTLGFLRSEQLTSYKFTQWLSRLGLERAFQIGNSMAQIPAPLILFQALSIIWLPAFIGTISADSIAIDRYRNTLRFLISRTSRTSYYLAKIISHFFFYLVLSAASFLMLLAIASFMLPDFYFIDSIRPAFIYVSLLAPYLLALLSAAILVSSLSKNPSNAIVRVQLLWIWLLLILVFVPKLSPFHYLLLAGLIAPFEGFAAFSALGYLVWTISLSMLGLLLFSRQDL